MNRWGGVLRRLGRCLAWSVAVTVGILCAARPATSQVVSPPDGSTLRVYLLTMGQGDALWERFGHNALVVRDLRTGTGTAWNWGVFDFGAPDFLTRFLTGDTRYWMDGEDFAATLERYRWLNRSLWLQELALPDSVKAGLVVALAENARPEQRYYRYDYFLDNCSTRVRDMIDRALGGALRQQLSATPAGTTFRRETERLLAGMPIAAVGVDVALGARADAPLSQWEASFVPMTLRDAIRAVRVPDGSGGTRPLVTRDEPFFTAQRAAEADAPPPLARATAVGGLALTVVLVGLALLAPAAAAARWGAVGLVGLWSLTVGVVGVVLLLAATVTRHVFWGANANLLVFSPLSLVLVPLLPMAATRAAGRARRWARGAALGTAGAALVGVLIGVSVGQPMAITAALALPVHAAVLFAVRRLTAPA